jgi:hypothetical protein
MQRILIIEECDATMNHKRTNAGNQKKVAW